MSIYIEQARFMRRIQEALKLASDASGDFAIALESSAGVNVAEGDPPAVLPEARGRRQQEIVDLLASVDSEEGLKTGEIARAVDMDQPNAYLALKALVEQALVEQVPDVEPQHWRLPDKYRFNRKIVNVAGLIGEGEWSTYGDISQVVYGHPGAGLAVGQVARWVQDFPTPHRVLMQKGRIHPEWTDARGNDAEVAAATLRSEGVELVDGRFAHPEAYVDHEELSRRLEQKQQDDAIRRRLQTIEDVEQFLTE